MKKIITIIVTATALIACSTQDTGWSLVWTESFDGPDIDTSAWSRVENGRNDWNNMMSLREDLAFIENGELVLLGKVNDGAGDETTHFVTGGVHSRGKKAFRMCKIEIRAKFNNANGFWPALWLMPNVTLPEPVYAELDIMEHLNHDDFVYQTVHSYYSLNVDRDNPPNYNTCNVNKNDWNTYSVEIYQDRICMLTNGITTLTYPRVEGKEYQFPWPEYPFYIILSNQLEGSWVGPADKKEELPSELRIDWIKVYQWK